MFFIILCSFFVCWKPIANYFPVHPFPVDVSEKNVIKILTYNVMAFGYQDHTPTQPNPIIQYIANSGADIVCLQEYMIGTQSNFLTREKVERALNMYPYHFTVPLVRKSRYWIGLAIYSKFPILSSRKILYDSTFNGSTIHELDIKGKKLYVVNNHLESFKLTMEDRTRYTEFFRNINSESFDDLKEAVQKKISTAYLIRTEQAEIVTEEIEKLNGDYLLVCGDFNDTPVSYAYRIIRGTMVDAFAASGTGLGITYNQNFYWYRIDHILHSPNMKAWNAQVDKIAVSDHYPMWCYLELN
jgi:endonuclease/exonuclease/phosphatase family metal-dependent hydrolase